MQLPFPLIKATLIFVLFVFVGTIIMYFGIFRDSSISTASDALENSPQRGSSVSPATLLMPKSKESTGASTELIQDNSTEIAIPVFPQAVNFLSTNFRKYWCKITIASAFWSLKIYAPPTFNPSIVEAVYWADFEDPLAEMFFKVSKICIPLKNLGHAKVTHNALDLAILALLIFNFF
ncbi:hypothetical protein DI09_238p20 [Mitosporidium daphniae]|uniref:Uncharacterized protein n=1 Tax=Mitosporidium daphniae TaxID=1485682 RepID=A0A098VT38_9MICR|nr:uncharacterized protein DI09_238p20 [Mitosporidium daphniae]KGG51954.1 hypothetical protein DI09_238p20 [Mitosporidium daphniae]|eukprot:XP_013238390.1 uncharacterized protein DI09_238p20 [Mitosporidium daphniae]